MNFRPPKLEVFNLDSVCFGDFSFVLEIIVTKVKLSIIRNNLV